MKLMDYKVRADSGIVEIGFQRNTQEDFMVNGEFDPSLGRILRIPVDPVNDVNPKERLVEYLGQSVADAIEAEYWTAEIIAQAQENIVSSA